MADVVHEDVIERILTELDVKDLIRYKSVCKSWYSIITSRRFANLHLNRSYNKDRYNNELGHRRIIYSFKESDHHLVGSSNGLVCILFPFKGSKLLAVGNPLTRDMRKLKLPECVSSSLCYGFGYDSSTDDYKVIFGAPKGKNQTRFEVLSLKSNEWKIIRQVKYTFISDVGILCNGALHWIVSDENMKKLIIAFDLSKEEFREIPQADDARFECSNLGVIKNCLCMYQSIHSCLGRWLMREYNVKESWDVLRHDGVMTYDIAHYFNRLDQSIYHHRQSWFSGPSKLHWDYAQALVFVQSLVSPHVNGRPMRVFNA